MLHFYGSGLGVLTFGDTKNSQFVESCSRSWGLESCSWTRFSVQSVALCDSMDLSGQTVVLGAVLSGLGLVLLQIAKYLGLGLGFILIVALDLGLSGQSLCLVLII